MIKILDHGYAKIIPDQCWGNDAGIIESARQSVGGEFKGWGTPDEPGDERLLRRLWLGTKDTGQLLPVMPRHSSPFEHAGLTVEIQAPIVVFREWHRHRTQSYNEMSGRYTVLPDLYYLPSIERLMEARQSTKNKQGSEGGFTDHGAAAIQRILLESYGLSRAQYNQLINMGVAREVARLCLPVSQYSRMRASANLLNWLRFLTLRMAPDAQWEIRQYANVVEHFVRDRFPRTHGLFMEGSGQI